MKPSKLCPYFIIDGFDDCAACHQFKKDQKEGIIYCELDCANVSSEPLETEPEMPWE
jgi:hypothetical protein